MSTFTTAARRFIADEDGVTALEYGMIAALIAAAIVTTVAALGTRMDAVVTSIKTAIGG